MPITTDDDVNKVTRDKEGAPESYVRDDVLERILGGGVCRECNANNPVDADTCRKCGAPSIRRRARQYRDE